MDPIPPITEDEFREIWPFLSNESKADIQRVRRLIDTLRRANAPIAEERAREEALAEGRREFASEISEESGVPLLNGALTTATDAGQTVRDSATHASLPEDDGVPVAPQDAPEAADNNDDDSSRDEVLTNRRNTGLNASPPAQVNGESHPPRGASPAQMRPRIPVRRINGVAVRLQQRQDGTWFLPLLNGQQQEDQEERALDMD